LKLPASYRPEDFGRFEFHPTRADVFLSHVGDISDHDRARMGSGAVIAIPLQHDFVGTDGIGHPKWPRAGTVEPEPSPPMIAQSAAASASTKAGCSRPDPIGRTFLFHDLAVEHAAYRGRQTMQKQT
jgi:hypothetical protein